MRSLFTSHVSALHSPGYACTLSEGTSLIDNLLTYTVLGVKISHGYDYTSCTTLGHLEMEFWCGTCRYDTQAQWWVLHCQGCPFWCHSAQKEATWRGRHAKQAENVAFSGGKCWWNGLKLSQNNPSSLAHHFHQVSLPGSSSTMCYHAKPYRPGQRLLGSVRGWKKHDRVWGGDYLTLNLCP